MTKVLTKQRNIRKIPQIKVGNRTVIEEDETFADSTKFSNNRMETDSQTKGSTNFYKN